VTGVLQTPRPVNPLPPETMDEEPQSGNTSARAAKQAHGDHRPNPVRLETQSPVSVDERPRAVQRVDPCGAGRGATGSRKAATSAFGKPVLVAWCDMGGDAQELGER